MDLIPNAALYLTKYPKDLHKILPQGKSNGGFFRSATRVDFVIEGQALRFNFMPKAELKSHLLGLAGYLKKLRDTRVNTDGEIRRAAALLPQIVCVLGGEFPKPFSPYSEIMEMLFVVAHHYQGYVFVANSLLTPGMQTLCGPLVLEVE